MNRSAKTETLAIRLRNLVFRLQKPGIGARLSVEDVVEKMHEIAQAIVAIAKRLESSR